jgi:hypothetical protein
MRLPWTQAVAGATSVACCAGERWLGIDAAAIPSGLLSISAPFQKRRRGVETRLVFGEDQPKADPVLLRYIARGFAWWDEIMAGASLVAIAKREKVTSRLVARHLDAAFLAPDIVKAIVEGALPWLPDRNDAPRRGAFIALVGAKATARFRWQPGQIPRSALSLLWTIILPAPQGVFPVVPLIIPCSHDQGKAP